MSEIFITVLPLSFVLLMFISALPFERLNLGSFTSNKFIYTSLNNSQSNRALCFVLRDKSILNLLQRASREFDVPGNLFLAISRESTTNFLLIFSF